MTTARQIQSKRSKALKSTGPKTPAGKARVEASKATPPPLAVVPAPELELASGFALVVRSGSKRMARPSRR